MGTPFTFPSRGPRIVCTVRSSTGHLSTTLDRYGFKNAAVSVRRNLGSLMRTLVYVKSLESNLLHYSRLAVEMSIKAG